MSHMSHETSEPPAPHPTDAPSKRRVAMRMLLPEWVVFESRWLLYPVNMALLGALVVYIIHLLYTDMSFTIDLVRGVQDSDQESLMVFLLGLVDAAMVANLIVMIVMGSHQVFISKFDLERDADRPQFLDHMDTGVMKTKVALSTAGITSIQILKDFVHLDTLEWETVVHRCLLHGLTLVTAFVFAAIWRIMHPTSEHN